MLSLSFATLFRVAALGLVVLAAVGCAGSREAIDEPIATGNQASDRSQVEPDAESAPSGPGAFSAPDESRPVIVISDGGRPRTGLATSVMAMFEAYDTIIVGRVTDVLIPYDPRRGFLGEPTPAPSEPLPSGHPKSGAAIPTPSAEELARPPGRTWSVYSIEVIRSVGSLESEAGDRLSVHHGGGIWNGEEHRSLGDPVLEIGATYLMFLNRKELPEDQVAKYVLGDFWDDASKVIMQGGVAVDYLGSAFGRFLIDAEGKLQPVHENWSQLQAVRDLTGRTVDEAIGVIEKAIAGEPIPTPVPPPPTPTPRPTPRAIAAVTIDTGTDGNSAKSLGARDVCGILAVGGSKTIDVVIEGIPPRTEYVDGHYGAMIGFQFSIVYDPAKVKITAVDTDMLLAANDGSNTMYVGHALDGDDAKNGRLTVAALDLNQDSVQESGNGVLARITLEGVSAGMSELRIENVQLADTWNNPYKVDAIEGARIVVGGSCP